MLDTYSSFLFTTKKPPVEVLFDSNDGSVAEDSSAVSRLTHTIDLSSIDGSLSTTPALTSLNPLAVAEDKKRKMTHLIIVAVCALFGLGAVGAVIWMMIKIFSK